MDMRSTFYNDLERRGVLATTEGFKGVRQLEMQESRVETPDHWVVTKDYYFKGRLVRRNVQLEMKRGLEIVDNLSL